jgi:hypothetical protein
VKWLSLVAAIAAFGTGWWAAWLWYQASRITPDPDWQKDYLTGVPFQPPDPELTQMGWTDALLRAGQASAKLNADAAYYTAVTVGLSAIASLAGWLASNG